MTYRVRNIAIAVGLAILAALMISYYVTSYKRHVQRGASDATVLVASKDIPVGTLGTDLVHQHMLKSVTVTRTSVVPGAISSGSELAGLVATQSTYAGEQVSTRRFAPQADAGLRSKITGPERVIQVPGDANQLLSGTLRTNDHVDVVGYWPVGGASGVLVSRIILRNILVLRAPTPASSEAAKLTSSSNAPLYVQLKVTDFQAPQLFWLMQNGKWSLQLRPTLHATDVSHNVEDAITLLGPNGARWLAQEEKLVGGGQ